MSVLLVLVCAIQAGVQAVGSAPVQQHLEIRVLRSTVQVASGRMVTSGALDSYFEPLHDDRIVERGVFWLKLSSPSVTAEAPGLPVVIVHAAPRAHVDLFAAGGAMPLAATLAAYRGMQERVFVLPSSFTGHDSAYARIETRGSESQGVRLYASTLDATLKRGAMHARMITFAVGGLVSMSLGALLIWFVLADRLFILYPAFFLLQALYIAFLSGEGFDWPLLDHARPLASFAWNVPVGLSGAVGCLFARESADLKDFSPGIYRIFGWFAVTFVAVTCANLAKLFGYASLVNALGNLVFFVGCVFTIAVVFSSWRRGNRAAGWFLSAWGLLTGFAIAATLHFSWPGSDDDDTLLYYGLPLSMMAAAVLIALGAADRLRRQRAALTDAERRAKIDPLTGVLNRRSFIERLDVECLRARTRGLPISVLFIDLDHFKLINDTYGHQAGDACLRAIIGPIQTELRQSSDVIGRFGGEEFVVMLSSAGAEAAAPIAQRILERVANVCVEGYGAPIRLTCSIGIAASNVVGVWGEHLINRADSAVYAAKRLGRNQVQMALSADGNALTPMHV